MSDVETEIREMLRSKAGDAVLSPVIPVETVSRANRRRAFVGVGMGLAAAAVVVGTIVGVTSLGGSRTIGLDDQPLEPKRTLSIELHQGAHAIVEGHGSVWAAGSSDVARIDPRRGTVVRTIGFTGPPRVVDGATEQDVYEIVPTTLTAGEDAMWVLGQQGTRFSATAQPIAPPDGGEPSATTTTRFSGDAVMLRPANPPSGEVQGQVSVDDWSLIRIDPRDNSWRVAGTVRSLERQPRFMKAAEGAVWVAIETGSGGGEVLRISPSTGRTSARIPVAHGSPMGIAAEGGWVYVPLAVGEGGRVLLRIDPTTNRIADEIAIPGAAWAFSIAAADGDVWVSVDTAVERGAPYRLARIDARSGRVLGTIQVPYIFSTLSLDGGTLWGVPESDVTLVQRIVGNRLAGTLTTRYQPGAILARDGGLWAGTAESELTLTRYQF